MWCWCSHVQVCVTRVLIVGFIVETLAGIGVIPILSALKLHPLRPNLADVCYDAACPDADRLLRLARFERVVLDAHGSQAQVAETMCLPCEGCNPVAHWGV